MKRCLSILGLTTGLLLIPGCIQQETTHTLYLSPDGQVVWTTIERDIRSDAKEPAERNREEQEFLDKLATGAHPIPIALQHLGGDSVRIRVLRRERPYAVMTEARFTGLDQVFQRLFDELKLQGTAEITREGSETTLSINLGPQTDTEPTHDSQVMALADCDAPYRIVLTEGRFVTADGFTLSDDGAVAVLDEKAVEEPDEYEKIVKLSLTWTTTSPVRD